MAHRLLKCTFSSIPQILDHPDNNKNTRPSLMGSKLGHKKNIKKNPASSSSRGLKTW
jgi:hypothetical protein